MRKKIDALYVHIPFCEHICAYCDFTKLFYNKRFSEPYLKALFKEIDSYNIKKVKTIYIGGGTPTSLAFDELDSLLAKISPLLDNGGEFSVEANVENLSEDKLRLLKKYGVNRLSVGVEATSEKALKLLNRKHSFADVKKVIAKARTLGFDNINVDLIYGYPFQSLDDLKDDLENILSLKTEHISIYSLTVEKGTIFANTNTEEQDEEQSRLYYEEILKTLRRHGYKRYEVSNFALPGYFSKHNLTYWKDEPYFGVGLGASGYIDNYRYTNTKNLTKYIDGEYIEEKEELSKDEEIEDFLLTNLRLEDGFKASTFKERFNVDFLGMFSYKAKKLIDNKLLNVIDDTIKLSDEGMMLLNRVLLELL